jgi:ABC-type glycerol-3-phosphate transport system permease component
MFAGLSIAVVPLIVIYLVFHRQITKGIALGGVYR